MLLTLHGCTSTSSSVLKSCSADVHVWPASFCGCCPPGADSYNTRIWYQMDLASVWWWCCFAGNSALLPGLLRVASVGPLPGHCFCLLVSCPWLLSCFEKSKYVGAVEHSAATADLLTRGCCNRMQHLVVATYVTALASATGQGVGMGICPCSCQWVLQGIHLSTGKEVCQTRLPCPYQTGDVAWLCLPHVHPAPLLSPTSCCT